MRLFSWEMPSVGSETAFLRRLPVPTRDADAHGGQKHGMCILLYSILSQ